MIKLIVNQIKLISSSQENRRNKMFHSWPLNASVNIRSTFNRRLLILVYSSNTCVGEFHFYQSIFSTWDLLLKYVFQHCHSCTSIHMPPRWVGYKNSTQISASDRMEITMEIIIQFVNPQYITHEYIAGFHIEMYFWPIQNRQTGHNIQRKVGVS